MITFLSMWFFNFGEAFHPHSVDVDHRHKLFLVVCSTTECKLDFAVKSISEFAAPRGSSSSKFFSSIVVFIAVAGFLGTSRWAAVGDAQRIEEVLSYLGFLSLFLVAAYELDVVPERFYEQKLINTIWLMEKLKLQEHVDFNLSIYDEKFREFIRDSKHLIPSFNEHKYISRDKLHHKPWEYDIIWNSMHMIGALGFMIFCTSAVIINDIAEEKVAWITGSLCITFCCLGYLTGSYVPILSINKCYVMIWNPFINEPNYMFKLVQAVRDYNKNKFTIENETLTSTRRRRKSITKKKLEYVGEYINATTPEEADTALDMWTLKMARYHPNSYVRTIGYILVMSELIALLTPAVAIGLQWVTALCDGPPMVVIIELIRLFYVCLTKNECEFASDDNELHCILK